MKRVFDFSVASVLVLLLIIPIVVVSLILLLAHGKQGVLFKQTRTCKSGCFFELYKFKTMTDKRDASGKLLPDEKRITAIGNFLRKTSLDELPQLFNVLKGDMSLVGPRPLLPKYLPLYSKEQNRRHEVKPGITGWAQVNGRNAISWQEKFELDVWYVDHQSFWLDMKILFLTVKKVVGRKDIMPENPANFGPFTGNN